MNSSTIYGISSIKYWDGSEVDETAQGYWLYNDNYGQNQSLLLSQQGSAFAPSAAVELRTPAPMFYYDATTVSSANARCVSQTVQVLRSVTTGTFPGTVFYRGLVLNSNNIVSEEPQNGLSFTHISTLSTVSEPAYLVIPDTGMPTWSRSTVCGRDTCVFRENNGIVVEPELQGTAVLAPEGMPTSSPKIYVTQWIAAAGSDTLYTLPSVSPGFAYGNLYAADVYCAVFDVTEETVSMRCVIKFENGNAPPPEAVSERETASAQTNPPNTHAWVVPTAIVIALLIVISVMFALLARK